MAELASQSIDFVNSIRNGDFTEAQQLLDKGCDPLLEDDKGWTAAHWCSYWGNVDFLRVLLKNQPDLKGRTTKEFKEDVHSGCTPLQVACWSGSTNVVKYLVEEEHCLMEHGDDGGRLPLHYAAGYGGIDVVKYLVEQGCEKDAIDGKQRTALHFAAWNGESEVVKYLLELGVNKDAIDAKGMTALHSSSWRGKDEVVSYLLQAQSRRDITDDKGNTPLDYAWRSEIKDLFKHDGTKHGPKEDREGKVTACGVPPIKKQPSSETHRPDPHFQPQHKTPPRSTHQPATPAPPVLLEPRIQPLPKPQPSPVITPEHAAILATTPEVYQFRILRNKAQGIKIFLIDEMQAEWEKLSDFLELPYTTVSNLRARQEFTPESACRSVIVSWLNGGGLEPKTWGTLVEVLKDMKKGTLANKLAMALKP